MSTQPSDTRGFATASGGQYVVSETSGNGGYKAVNETSGNGGYKLVNETSANGGGGNVTTGTMISVGNTVLTQPPARAYQNFNEASYKQHIHEILPTQFEHRHNITLSPHQHSVNFTIPNHQHQINFTIPDHRHSLNFTIPNHTHNVNVTIPEHTHDIEYGIYEYPTLPTVNILLDGVVIASNVTTNQSIDLSNKFTYLGGTHSLEIQSLSKTGNNDGLGRASLDLFVSGFVSY